jgi:hypothetical protein
MDPEASGLGESQTTLNSGNLSIMKKTLSSGDWEHDFSPVFCDHIVTCLLSGSLPPI